MFNRLRKYYMNGSDYCNKLDVFVKTDKFRTDGLYGMYISKTPGTRDGVTGICDYKMNKNYAEIVCLFADKPEQTKYLLHKTVGDINDQNVTEIIKCLNRADVENIKMYNAEGFTVVDKSENSKYQTYYPDDIAHCTLIRRTIV